MIYVLLSGHYPFNAKRYSVIQHVIVNKPVEFPIDYWKNISEEAKDLIERMLCKTPLKRYTLTEWLKHDWFQNQITQTDDNSEDSPDQYSEILEKLKKYIIELIVIYKLKYFVALIFNNYSKAFI